MGYKVWECKFVVPDDVALPQGADAPMRQSVIAAYARMVGSDSEVITIFSGWAGSLTEVEKEIIEEQGTNLI